MDNYNWKLYNKTDMSYYGCDRGYLQQFCNGCLACDAGDASRQGTPCPCKVTTLPLKRFFVLNISG